MTRYIGYRIDILFHSVEVADQFINSLTDIISYDNRVRIYGINGTVDDEDE